MRQSITTKYVGPTNSRGSRIKSTARKASNGSPAQALTVPYGYGNTEEEHCAGAKALAEKLEWAGLWVGGGNVDENGYVFVNLPLTPQMIAGHTLDRHPLGTEGRDWFHVERRDK